ncbi:MAG: tRNA (guanosine(37)-N1)-methyltransferase TrmD [Candidatus Dojkabacteria bacterium]|jgi:tRNA (guanine37-N1)-methyltransferase|nr:tRNA (guanosine(37)-N1)-methyltransferase TrmD [Candidatus Dojkabacteria bacterium]
MQIDILTIFPNMFDSPFAESIVKRAQEMGKVDIRVHDLRRWTSDKHKTVDAKPFGGGAGMVMMIEPIYRALEEVDLDHKAHRILLTAKGARIVQEKVRELSGKDHIILVCGHYEEIDHRVHDYLVDECISIGDFILTGGEIPAMALTDAVVRLIPGVLGNEESLKDESFSVPSLKLKALRQRRTSLWLESSNVLEYPQYTRPAEFRTDEGKVLKVPRVLLSGNHGEIKKWRGENRKKASS